MVVITRSIKGFVTNTCVQGNYVGQLGEPCGIHSIFGICGFGFGLVLPGFNTRLYFQFCKM